MSSCRKHYHLDIARSSVGGVPKYGYGKSIFLCGLLFPAVTLCIPGISLLILHSYELNGKFEYCEDK